MIKGKLYTGKDPYNCKSYSIVLLEDIRKENVTCMVPVLVCFQDDTTPNLGKYSVTFLLETAPFFKKDYEWKFRRKL